MFEKYFRTFRFPDVFPFQTGFDRESETESGTHFLSSNSHRINPITRHLALFLDQLFWHHFAEKRQMFILLARRNEKKRI